MKNFELVKYEKHPGYAVVFLHDVGGRNALSSELIEELSFLFDDLERDFDIVSVIITGFEKSFIAGGNIRQMAPMTPKEAGDYSRFTTKLYEKMESSKKIFISAVNGYAFGAGVEFMLSCDFCIASQSAKFGLPEVTLGIIPGGGATQKLVNHVGLFQAKRLILTGSTIDAQEALRIGLLTEMVQDDKLLESAKTLANRLSENGPDALAYAKESINQGLSIPLSAGIEYEKNNFALCFATEDQKEGMNAFLEKRPPAFSKRFQNFVDKK